MSSISLPTPFALAVPRAGPPVVALDPACAELEFGPNSVSRMLSIAITLRIEVSSPDDDAPLLSVLDLNSMVLILLQRSRA